MIRSHGLSGADRDRIGTPIARTIPRFTAASPPYRFAAAARMMCTLAPALARCRAAASPSPPLFPGPQ